jgi:hypothetical protein
MEANLARADDRIVEINVAYWHSSDLASLLGDVRSWGQSGNDLKASTLPSLTQCRLQELCFVGNEKDVRSRSHGGYLCSP